MVPFTSAFRSNEEHQRTLMELTGINMNNDTYPDIFDADAARRKRLIKTVTTFENWDRYQYKFTNGYYHQLFTKICCKLEQWNNTFQCEIGRLCEAESTDWGTIFEADPWTTGKDIFVANGIFMTSPSGFAVWFPVKKR